MNDPASEYDRVWVLEVWEARERGAWGHSMANPSAQTLATGLQLLRDARRRMHWRRWRLRNTDTGQEIYL